MKNRSKNISLRPPVHDAIQHRAEAAGESFSRTIERLWDEANGNLQTARIAVHDDLSAIRLQAAIAQKALEQVHSTTAVMDALHGSIARILVSVGDATLRLARPEVRMARDGRSGTVSR